MHGLLVLCSYVGKIEKEGGCLWPFPEENAPDDGLPVLNSGEQLILVAF